MLNKIVPKMISKLLYNLLRITSKEIYKLHQNLSQRKLHSYFKHTSKLRTLIVTSKNNKAA